jgi:D-beta-D-heptose 7-phosphate kinase/D-beta-D-heptose 1-phosphate adenosyltransferase
MKLRQVVDAFTGMKVVVIGEAMLDSYLKGSARRLCREAPVPVVDVTECVDAPGGAANTAVNAAMLGAEVAFFGAVGDDDPGRRLLAAMRARGVAAAHVLSSPGRQTLAKSRIVANDQILARFDQGTTGPIAGREEHALIGRLSECWKGCDAVIVSDYGYGILTLRMIRALARLQARSPRTLVVDSSRRLAQFRPVAITAVKPNFEEALRVVGLEGDADGSVSRVERIAACGATILDITGAQIAAVTLDTDGALVFEPERPPYRTYAKPMPHCRAAGAGDTFTAALTLALAAGATAAAAAEIASAAAAVAVAKQHTAGCSRSELLDDLSAGGKYLPDRQRLAARLDSHREQGLRIVFTNGCFDILHRGHVTYLNRAKALGDILVVGVNTDESVTRLKGPTRPVNALEDRVEVLAALSCVDYVVPFHEDTPCELVKIVRPNAFVKGGDYTRDRLPEAPLVEAAGGTVHIFPLVEDRSTSGIIERIRNTTAGVPAGNGQCHVPLETGEESACYST